MTIQGQEKLMVSNQFFNHFLINPEKKYNVKIVHCFWQKDIISIEDYRLEM